MHKRVLSLASLLLVACAESSDPQPIGAARERDAGLELFDASALDTGSIDSGDVVLYVAALDDGEVGSGTEIDPYRALDTAIAAAPSRATIRIAPGTYRARPEAATEAWCGNCGEHMTTVSFTRGFWVKGKSLSLIGDESDPRRVALETGAGYGVLVEGAEVRIVGLTITGGQRDADGSATSAAVVVKNSTVSLDRVWIVRNQSLRPGGEYPGVAGVAGREGAVIRMKSSIIYDNSWDGFVLYRGARGTIIDTEVDRGNGVGIAATWNGRLTAINNRVSRYWKGLGGFGTSRVVAHNNVVFENLTWGVWAAGEEGSSFELVNNTVAHQGNCSLALNPQASAVIRNNILAFGGRSAPQICPNVGVWLFGETGPRVVDYNSIHGHPLAAFWLGGTQPTGATGRDVSSDFVDHDGNVSVDPLLVDGDRYRLDPSSPAIDAGDPTILDLDGSRSDIGHFGGPGAGLTSFP